MKANNFRLIKEIFSLVFFWISCLCLVSVHKLDQTELNRDLDCMQIFNDPVTYLIGLLNIVQLGGSPVVLLHTWVYCTELWGYKKQLVIPLHFASDQLITVSRLMSVGADQPGSSDLGLRGFPGKPHGSPQRCHWGRLWAHQIWQCGWSHTQCDPRCVQLCCKGTPLLSLMTRLVQTQ